MTVTDDEAKAGTDYDVDNDGLIEIDSLAKLNAVRWDLDGNGSASNSGYSATTTSAFPNPAANMGCPDGPDSDQLGDCVGYELTADLDFDTDGDGRTHANGTGDSGDAYYNDNAGWEPIGGTFSAVFRGNGHVVRNLFTNRTWSGARAGLFNAVENGRVESLGVVDGYALGYEISGLLTSELKSGSRLVGCYSTGRVRATEVGGYWGRPAGSPALCKAGT